MGRELRPDALWGHGPGPVLGGVLLLVLVAFLVIVLPALLP